MAFDQKIKYFCSEMQARGEVLFNLTPPMVRILWRLGLQFPPPIFLPFRTVATYGGLLFSCGMLVTISAVILVLAQLYPIINEVVVGDSKLMLELVLLASSGGALFGLTYALSLRKNVYCLIFQVGRSTRQKAIHGNEAHKSRAPFS